MIADNKRAIMEMEPRATENEVGGALPGLAGTAMHLTIEKTSANPIMVAKPRLILINSVPGTACLD